MKALKNFSIAAFSALIITACSDDAKQVTHPAESKRPVAGQPAAYTAKVNRVSGDVFVHLFEWRWGDVAAECESFLGPNGYAAVQVSPAQEHITGSPWWTRYQPVSYRIESRGGTRAEFADMVGRCKAAGVAVYADAVVNHMAEIGSGTGVAGSVYGPYSYPVPYAYDDFHHCGRNGNDAIANYQDLWEVQTCNLGTLPDLDTAKPAVQAKIAAYLNDLLSLGVTGFRLDAAKHMGHEDIGGYLALLDTRPYVFQEVIDWGTEAIDAMAYLENGSVTEFKYAKALYPAFVNGQLDTLFNLGEGAAYLPADKAIVFVDNHDLQRGHVAEGEMLNYKFGELYNLANIFMLGWPYGYPKVMSSYYFEDSDQGPPANRPAESGACNAAWVCEHRRPAMAGMVGFRKATQGAPVTHWQAFGGQAIAFGRGGKGFVVINAGLDGIDGTFATGMQGGEYCNVVSTGGIDKDCAGAEIRVDATGILQISLAPMSAVVIQSSPTR
ncbi:MAG TPA: alpha-amylase family protein [Xanthomonadales bacterium]